MLSLLGIQAALAAPCDDISPDDIAWDGLHHDTFHTDWRAPGGARPAGSDVRLVLRACQGDLTAARLRLWNGRTRTESWVELTVEATGVDPVLGPVDLWETTLTLPDDPAIHYYFFEVEDGPGAKVWFVDDDPVFLGGGFGATIAEWDDSRSFQITAYDPNLTAPAWAEGAVVYQIFPDRFRNGDPTNDPIDGEGFSYGHTDVLLPWDAPLEGRCVGADQERAACYTGGDLAGITAQLDMLEALGVDVLYLNPIFRSATNHRYDTLDYRVIDDELGTLDDFTTLVTAARERGISLLLDGVFNDDDDDVDLTTRREFWPDDDADTHGDSSVASTLACAAPADHVENSDDCDDDDPSINPAATEVCDAARTDEDCNGVADDDDSGVLGSSLSEWFEDADGDSYGAGTSTLACAAPGSTWLATDGDCDDTDSAVNPGATELCDDVDNDCDSTTTGAGSVSYDSGSGTLTDVSSSFSTTAGTVASVSLSSGTYYFCDDTFYASMTASSGVTVELVGTGSAALSGDTTDTILDMSGADVTFTDITLEDGYAASYGGAIYCDSTGTLTFTSATLQDNMSGYNGGGIYAEYCDFTATDSTFTGNSASAHGGAFYLDNVDIDDNYAYYQGAGGTIRDGALDAIDTVWDGNDNAYASVSSSAAALNVVHSDFTCEKDSRGGFINNTPANTYGTGAPGFSPYTGNLMYSIGCDWGTAAGGDDNGYYDIYWNNPDYFGSDAYYTADDDVYFYCDDTYGCFAYSP